MIETIQREILGNLEKNQQRYLIPVLQKIQEKFHYISPEVFPIIGKHLGVSVSQIMSVATFYNQFRLKPCGKHRIRVCVGTACHVSGAESVWQGFKQFLGLHGEEDTDVNKEYTLEKVACLGCCMMAPVVQIDTRMFGWVKPDQARNILADFSKQVTSKDTPKGCRKILEPMATIKICLCSSCLAAGAKVIYEEVQRQIWEMALPARVQTVGCWGLSYHSPLLEIELPNSKRYFYAQVQEHNIRKILLTHVSPVGILSKVQVLWNTACSYLAFSQEDNFIPKNIPHPMSSEPQLALENAGQHDPLDIGQYEKSGGWQAIKDCLKKTTVAFDIISQIEQSGLRGRGGAGFPTGKKWHTVYNQPERIKYIIANGDEGDPGAFMDRLILESFPFRVLEGMMIAGWVMGAKHGYLYIRAEYPLAVERVCQAIDICRTNGYLGEVTQFPNFSLDLEVVTGAGAFVCGEETALLASLEGYAGRPRYRPPFPALQGLWGYPTLINNIETYSLIPWILRNGHDAFTKIGTTTSHGTKTFALAGKIRHGGLVEVPMGKTIRDIVEVVGGGVPKGFKAVQIGGPSGGCIPQHLADIPLDYEKLKEYGAMMGSGGLVVLDSEDCMVDICRYFLRFTQSESCGKCTPCRLGTKKMLEILDRICQKKGKLEDLDALERLANFTSQASLCGLGKSCGNPVLSTLRYFREEYIAHIQGTCPSLRCQDFIHYEIQDKCIGCTKCAQQCPAQAITGIAHQQHKIDIEKCTKCDLCRSICEHSAIIRNNN